MNNNGLQGLQETVRMALGRTVIVLRPLGTGMHSECKSHVSSNREPKSCEILMFVYLQKDAKQCFDATNLTVLIVLVYDRHTAYNLAIGHTAAQ